LHREASQIVADIYDLHANATERAILLRDFYGREAALLPLPSKSEDSTRQGRSGLSATLQGETEEQRRRILSSLKENLDLMLVCTLMSVLHINPNHCRFNNSERGSLRHPIVHRVLWEYLSEIGQTSDDGEREKTYYEIFER
jgi:pumilio family protein 6